MPGDLCMLILKRKGLGWLIQAGDVEFFCLAYTSGQAVGGYAGEQGGLLWGSTMALATLISHWVLCLGMSSVFWGWGKMLHNPVLQWGPRVGAVEALTHSSPRLERPANPTLAHILLAPLPPILSSRVSFHMDDFCPALFINQLSVSKFMRNS